MRCVSPKCPRQALPWPLQWATSADDVKRRDANTGCRFGQQLKSSLVQDWRFYYIDYDGLKHALRIHQVWDEDAEQNFVQQLEKELDKVYSFTTVKSEEIVRRIGASEKEVNDVVSRADENEGSADQEGPSEEDFELLEEDLSDIIAEVHDLAKFAQLNYTGFQKIIKKHDVGARKRIKALDWD